MRAKAVLLTLSSIPLLTACSFLLDFNSLQGGKEPADASSDAGNGGSHAADDSGTADDSGAAGAPASDA